MTTSTGRNYIINTRLYGHSVAMQAVHDHACDWLLTVDCLKDYDGITADQAVSIADAGFRGDDSRAAKRFLIALEIAE